MANTEPHVDSAGGSGEVMDRWKTDNCESGGDRLSSRSTSLSRRLIGLAGVAALTVGGAGSVLLGGGAAFAATPTATTLTSNPYQVGSGAISGLTDSFSNLTAGSNSVDTFTFVATDGIGTTGTAITLNFPNAGAATGPIVSITNLTAGGTQVVPSADTTDTTTGLTVQASTLNAIPAGDTVRVVFSAKNTTAGSYSVTGSTNSDPVQVAAASGFTLVLAPTPVAPSDSVSSNVSGTSAVTYTLGTFGIYDTTTTTTTALATGSTLKIAVAGATFTGTLNDYTIVDTPASGTATTQHPTVATTTSGGVTLTTAAPLNVGDTLTITANNVINPTTASATPALTITPSTGADAWEVVDPGTAANSGVVASVAFPAISYGTTATAVTGFTVSASPSTVSATATYNVAFTATSGIAATTGTTTLTFPVGTAFPSGPTVFALDVTKGLTIPVTAAGSVAAGSSTQNVVTITNGTTAVAAGDSVQYQILGATSPASAGTESASVVTSGDGISVSTTYAITLATSVTNLPTVTLSNGALSAASTYTITGMEAAAAMPVGVAASPGQIGIFVPSATILPTAAADYMITDVTNAAATAAPATVQTDLAPPTGTTGVDLTVSKAIASGDVLSITITGVINPSAASSQYTAEFFGLNAITTAVSSAAPTAASTYPNGAFVQSGAQIDVVAGGVGFGIPSMTDYQQIAASDSSAVVSGSFPTATSVRTGTLLKVLGSPAIYVVGTNGEAYPFSTPTEFSSDGYSAMSVVNVPSLGSLTVGSGTAPTAAVTMPDGALVQSGSTIYVYAGGVAFGIPTFANYQTIAAATGTAVVQGTVSNTTGATLTAGTLVQPIGSAGIYVSNGTSLYQFSTASQFSSDGYNGANVVPVPSITALTVA